MKKLLSILVLCPYLAIASPVLPENPSDKALGEYVDVLYLEVGALDNIAAASINIDKINNAKQGQVISLLINSPGGWTVVMNKYIEAIDRHIKEKQGAVEVIVIAAASAAATMVCSLKQNPKVVVTYSPASQFMVHKVNIRKQGNLTKEEKQDLDLSNAKSKEIISTGCPGLLDDKDWQAVDKGEDVYITGYDWDKNIGKSL